MVTNSDGYQVVYYRQMDEYYAFCIYDRLKRISEHPSFDLWARVFISYIHMFILHVETKKIE